MIEASYQMDVIKIGKIIHTETIELDTLMINEVVEDLTARNKVTSREETIRLIAAARADELAQEHNGDWTAVKILPLE